MGLWAGQFSLNNILQYNQFRKWTSNPTNGYSCHSLGCELHWTETIHKLTTALTQSRETVRLIKSEEHLFPLIKLLICVCVFFVFVFFCCWMKYHNYLFLAVGHSHRLNLLEMSLSQENNTSIWNWVSAFSACKRKHSGSKTHQSVRWSITFTQIFFFFLSYGSDPNVNAWKYELKRWCFSLFLTFGLRMSNLFIHLFVNLDKKKSRNSPHCLNAFGVECTFLVTALVSSKVRLLYP